MPADSPVYSAEVLIIGGGLVGLTLGCALAGAGVPVVVVDSEAAGAAAEAGYDGRSSAIARTSQAVLAAIGLWQDLEAAAQPMLEIRVTDNNAPFFVHYDHRQLDGAPFGWMVENRALRRAQLARAAQLPALKLAQSTRLASLRRGPQGVTASLADGSSVTARLAVAADGRNSATRAEAGIAVAGWSYDQSGIVCTVGHERPHHGVAHERFLPAGPFAILPLVGNRSSIVWTEPTAIAKILMALDEARFLEEMSRRFGGHLGRLHLEGGRWSYPLALSFARSYVAERLVLAGDAAHGMHPLAGQGLNMGLRDVAALAEIVVEARRLGLDIGTADRLESYQRWRQADNLLMLAVTDGLNRLFSNSLGPVRLARDLGLGLVERLAPIKRFFMRHAMGLEGDLPRLMRGEAL